MVRQLQYLPPTDDKTQWMLEIRNRHRWNLRMGGEKVWLFKRKWVGQRCPNWDDVRDNHRRVDGCDICYGGGYIGGYYKPIQIVVSLISGGTSKVIRQYDYGMRKMFELRSWTLWKPRLRNKDFIVRDDGSRHWLQNVTPSRWKKIILRQNFDLAEIERSNIIYNIPVS